MDVYVFVFQIYSKYLCDLSASKSFAKVTVLLMRFKSSSLSSLLSYKPINGVRFPALVALMRVVKLLYKIMGFSVNIFSILSLLCFRSLFAFDTMSVTLHSECRLCKTLFISVLSVIHSWFIDRITVQFRLACGEFVNGRNCVITCAFVDLHYITVRVTALSGLRCFIILIR